MWGKISILAANLMMWATSAFAYGDEGGHMGGGGCMMNSRYGGILMWIILIILIGVIVYLVQKKGRENAGGETSPETALEILKKRYAAGEITRDEYERMRNDLGK